MTERDNASHDQNMASDPTKSVWVAANAGTGKTRVLTDRVARLLLHGQVPERILCLTYTKAAASEMQNRLFARLGEWAMLDDQSLRKQLDQLGETNVDDQRLRFARQLFAAALETPGGLKIQTIHSFCDNVLRRFPIEAGVSPKFNLLDDDQANQLRATVFERIAVSHAAEFDAFAKNLVSADLDRFLKDLTTAIGKTTRPPQPSDFGLTDADIANGSQASQFFTKERLDTLKTFCESLPENPKSVAIEAALSLSSKQLLKVLNEAFLVESKEYDQVRRPTTRINGLTKGESLDNLRSSVFALADDLVAVWHHETSLEAFHAAQVLHDFMTLFEAEYREAKAETVVLDYDDLIQKTAALLSNRNATQWVLYKLDGGIDHVLVDEAQDTSPLQWEIIEALTAEFSAGQSQSSADRTLFIVGDEKQSIYSFQGADPDRFKDKHSDFNNLLMQNQQRFEQKEIVFSFRSSVPIMKFVDAVLKETATYGLIPQTTHQSYFEEKPGRIEIWDFIPDEKTEKPDWWEPVDQARATNASLKLVSEITDFIQTTIRSKQLIPIGSDIIRPAKEGDFLILVQTRSRAQGLFQEIIRGLKNANLDIAGSDRFELGQELAVKDLISLLRFLATPQDSLSLAEFLRSPLGGFSEQDLFSLANQRNTTSLWQELQAKQQVWPVQVKMLCELLEFAPNKRPFEIIELVLNEYHGRQNIVSRLGQEAEEPLDEFLLQALIFEEQNIATLTNFVEWFGRSEMEIKRELENAQDKIRVMTVHGAKGLQSPIVIVADTAQNKAPPSESFYPLSSGGLGLHLTKANQSLAQKHATELRNDADRRERMRLLYVALTRAESWLVICGATTISENKPHSWYQICDRAFEAQFFSADRVGSRRIYEDDYFKAQVPTAQKDESSDAIVTSLDPIFRQKAPSAAGKELSISPSKILGLKALPGGSTDTQDAMRQGTLLHLLLEKFDDAEDLRQTGDQILARHGIPQQDQHLLDSAIEIYQSPKFSHLFGENSLPEIEVAAKVQGRLMRGIIDRLVIEENQITIIDFKTNEIVPKRPEDVPDGILRQLSAYREIVTQIYPNRNIALKILWTQSQELMTLPHEIVKDCLDVLQHLDHPASAS